MANYTILNDNPQHAVSADVVVYYDNTRKAQKFLVHIPGPDMGAYRVLIEELFGNEYKYSSEVINGILSKVLPEDEYFFVRFSNLAMNAVNLVCQGNRLSF